MPLGKLAFGTSALAVKWIIPHACSALCIVLIHTVCTWCMRIHMYLMGLALTSIHMSKV